MFMLKFLVQCIFVAAATAFCWWQQTNSEPISEDIQFQQNNQFYRNFRYKRSPPGSNDDANADMAEIPQNSTENMLDFQLSQPFPQKFPKHLKNVTTRTATGQLMTAVPSDDFGLFTFEFS